VVTEDYTGYIFAKPLRTKDKTTNALVEIVNILEKATDLQYNLKFIQADWGGKFCNKDLQTELRQREIQLKEIVPRYSETNTVAERTNRTILTMSRTALIAAEGYWDKASLWAVYVKNRLSHKALPKGMLPIELLTPKIHEQLRSNLNYSDKGLNTSIMKLAINSCLRDTKKESWDIPIPSKPIGY